TRRVKSSECSGDNLPDLAIPRNFSQALPTLLDFASLENSGRAAL
ncbi:MAG: hypothetical protein GY862_03945, partial [Gammaproteobacteria bacterium]|nr:hypothetical protein [Gammaproteobacteria bacterium]